MARASLIAQPYTRLWPKNLSEASEVQKSPDALLELREFLSFDNRSRLLNDNDNKPFNRLRPLMIIEGRGDVDFNRFATALLVLGAILVSGIGLELTYPRIWR